MAPLKHTSALEQTISNPLSDLPDGLYPFIDRHMPLAELAVIEAPHDLEAMFREQAARNGLVLPYGVPIELRCQTDAFGDAVFLIWWPSEGDRIHMLAPKEFRRGQA